MQGFGEAGRRVLGDLRAGSVGLLAACALLMTLGSGWVLYDLRNCAWEAVARESRNVTALAERALGRDAEVLDLALQAVARRTSDPEVLGAVPRLRDMALYDNALKARGTGMVLILDADGNVTGTSDGPVKGVNSRDRPHFAVHRERTHAGLYVGTPFVSRLTGEEVIPFSRRLTGADGEFAGVVVGTLKLSHVRGLFRSLNLQAKGAVSLHHLDGPLMVREPGASSGAADRGLPGRELYGQAASGSFVAAADADGVERRHEFARVGALPLVVSVAVSTEEILAGWRSKAAWVGVALLALCLGMLWSLGRLRRELRRRAWAERSALEANERLALLAATDPLTGLANRRRFDEALDVACAPAARAEAPMCLAMIDADHFKRLNDQHGHAAGDAALRAIAGRLAVRTRRPGELACRFGGEEFAAILPGHDLDAAQAWAERVRSEVAAAVMERDGLRISLSVGLALAPAGGRSEPGGLLAAADAALYEAKRAGRDRVCRAPQPALRVAAAA